MIDLGDFRELPGVKDKFPRVLEGFPETSRRFRKIYGVSAGFQKVAGVSDAL